MSDGPGCPSKKCEVTFKSGEKKTFVFVFSCPDEGRNKEDMYIREAMFYEKVVP